MYPREFPATRRGKPKRRAERRIYQALAGSGRRGFVYYEWRRGYERIELDFAVWIVDLGRFALQVKGGHYLLMEGEWGLRTGEGIRPIESCPLDQAWLAALELHDEIEERAATAYNPYVIPVLAFADMEPDPVIERLARRKGVYLVWRTGDLVADLSAVAGGRAVSGALSADRIRREVWAVTDGLIRLGDAGEAAGPVTKPPAPAGAGLIHIRAREVRLQRGIITGPHEARRGSAGPRWPSAPPSDSFRGSRAP